jgi:biopolymer transport protein ExbB
MIMGFEYLEHTAVEKKALAHAIRVALITTFAGLSIAIPTVVAGSYFRSRIRALLAEFEQVFLAVAKSVKNAPRPEPEAPPPQSQPLPQDVSPERRYA